MPDSAEMRAAFGPGVPALGVRENVHITQSQVAATLATLVGEDFRATSPESASPIPLQPKTDK